MLAALRKNEKGLTLIELLAVLVIIGIIAAIAIPAIGKTITNAEIKANEASRAMIQEAAQRYYMDHSINAITGGPTVPTTTAITFNGSSTQTSDGFVAALVTTGYLVSPPVLKADKTILANISIVVTPTDGVNKVVVTLT